MEVDEFKCTGCGLCADECVAGAIEIYLDKAVVDQDKCCACGQCAQNCPDGAIYEADA